MERPHFQIQMTGAAVSPETVSAGDLADLLKQIEKAIVETWQRSDPPEREREGPVVSLVGVDEGSAVLTLAVLQAASWAVSDVAQAVSTNNYAPLPPAAHKALRGISEQAVKQRWSVEFLPNPAFHIPEPAVINEGHQVPDSPPPPETRGTTTLYGNLVRIGGVQPKAEIRLPQGALLHVSVTTEMAKKLAPQLYADVGLEGEATWRTADWALIDFKATRVLDYRPAGLAQGFQELADAARGQWNNVDAEEFVRELRSGDEP